jgi:phosphatidylinositol alpha-1,6-mannosyltransferase
MKNTLLLTEIFPPFQGGSGNWFYEMYSRLDSNVVVITQKVDGKPEVEKVGNLKIYRVDFSPKSLRDMGIFSIYGIRYYLRLLRLVRRICKNEKIEVIHCGRVLPEGLLAMFLKFVFGYKYLVYIHGEDIEGALLSKEYRILVSRALKYADKIICNSKNSNKLLAKWGGDLLLKTKLLYPGVDTEKYKPFENSNKPYQGKTVIVTISRLQKRKGHDLLLDALPVIKNKIPNIHYLIVGSGEERARLKEKIISNNLSNCVELLDGITNDQIITYYNYADLFVLPNRRVGNDIEGLGIVLLEAQSCGVPVIAGDSGGTVETIDINKSGVVIDCTCTDVIATKIIEMLQSPDKLKSMGGSARKHILNNFSWKTQIQNANHIFDSF